MALDLESIANEVYGGEPTTGASELDSIANEVFDAPPESKAALGVAPRGIKRAANAPVADTTTVPQVYDATVGGATDLMEWSANKAASVGKARRNEDLVAANAPTAQAVNMQQFGIAGDNLRKVAADPESDIAGRDFEYRNKPPAPTMTLADNALAFAKGGAGLIKGAGMGAQMAGIDSGRYVKGFGQELEGVADSLMSPGGRAVQNNEMVRDDTLRFGDTPIQSSIMSNAMSLPSMALTMAMAGPIGRLLTPAASSALGQLAAHPGFIGKIAAAAPTAIAAGAGEGAITALQNAADAEHKVMALPFEQIRQSPKYTELMAQTNPAWPMQEREAHVRLALAKLVSDEVARDTFISTGGIGTLTGGGGVGVALRAKPGLAGAQARLAAGSKGAIAGLAEEIPQEILQSGGEKLVENATLKKYIFPNMDMGDGVVGSALSGGVAAAGMGGVFGGMRAFAPSQANAAETVGTQGSQGGALAANTVEPPPGPPPVSPRVEAAADLRAAMADPRSIAEQEAARQQAEQQAAQQAQQQAQAAQQQAQQAVVDQYGLPPAGSRVTAEIPGLPPVSGTVERIDADEEQGGYSVRLRTDDGELYVVTGEDAAVLRPQAQGDGSKANPLQADDARDVDAAVQQNTHPEPTPGQAEAGNYPMTHLAWNGLDISIETAKGGTRTAKDGSWSVPDFPAHYGRFKGTIGMDGDHLDTYVGPDLQSDHVFIVDQIDPATGKADEHKVFIGFADTGAVRDTYNRAFQDGSGDERAGHVTTMSVEQFKDWVKNGDLTKPIGYVQPSAPPKAKDVKAEPAPKAGMSDEDLSALFDQAAAEVAAPPPTAPPKPKSILTLADVPPKLLKKIKVPVDEMHNGEVKVAYVSANDAIADLDAEISAFEKLLACVRAA